MLLCFLLGFVGESFAQIYDTAGARALEKARMAKAKVKSMKQMSGDKVTSQIDFDEQGNRVSEFSQSWDGRVEINYIDGRRSHGVMKSREGDQICEYSYNYDADGNLVEQQQKSARGTLIGKWVWVYENGELVKQMFEYIDGSPPMGDGGPMYREHSTNIKFSSTGGLVRTKEIDAWASTADGGSFIKTFHEYDKDGRLLRTEVNHRPQMEREGSPNRPGGSVIVYNYDERGLLTGKSEEAKEEEESPGSEKLIFMAPVSRESGPEFVYEFWP